MEVGYHKKTMAGKRIQNHWHHRPYARTKHTPAIPKITAHKRRK